MPQSRDHTERGACARWEALLADAMDGNSIDEAEFAAHMAACPECAELFDAARGGREWLQFLAREPEAPSGMLERILARTGPGAEAGPAAVTAGGIAAEMPEPWQRPGLAGFIRRFAEPRLMMTAAMAFFSTALILNAVLPRAATLNLGSLRLNLRPALVRSYVERQFAEASVPIVRYYDHLQLVNQVQSTVREIKRSQQGAGESASPSQQPAGTGALKGTGSPRRTGPPQQVAAPATAAPQGKMEALLLDSQPGQTESIAKMRGKRSKSWIA